MADKLWRTRTGMHRLGPMLSEPPGTLELDALKAAHVRLQAELAVTKHSFEFLQDQVQEIETENTKLRAAAHARARSEGLGNSTAGMHPKLAAFTTLAETATVKSLVKGEIADRFKAIAAELQQDPSSLVLFAQHEACVQELAKAMSAEITARAADRAMLLSFFEVSAIGDNGFRSVYDSVWKLLADAEEVGIIAYSAARDSLQELIPGNCSVVQRAEAALPTQLYLDAFAVKTKFDQIARDLEETLAAKGLVELSVPKDLKGMIRIVEKTCLRKTQAGNASNVTDVVRAMIVMAGMNGVAAAIEALVELVKAGSIVVVRVKDRFLTLPSTGGWRDFMVNYYIVGDPNKHLCELQLVHLMLLSARKGLPGHLMYARGRNAHEEARKACPVLKAHVDALPKAIVDSGRNATLAQWQLDTMRQTGPNGQALILVFLGLDGFALKDPRREIEEEGKCGISISVGSRVGSGGPESLDKIGTWGASEKLSRRHDRPNSRTGWEGLTFDSTGNVTSLNLKSQYSDTACPIQQVPEFIAGFFALTRLSLQDWEFLKLLPASIGELSELVELDLRGCSSLESLPTTIGELLNLKSLFIEGCEALVLPKNLCDELDPAAKVIFGALSTARQTATGTHPSGRGMWHNQHRWIRGAIE